MTDELFARALAAARAHSLSGELFVSLLWCTGHRAASVRQLRWTDLSDIELDARRVLWRPEVDKIGLEHQNPLHSSLGSLLGRARAVTESTGGVYVFPNPFKPAEPMTGHQTWKLWREIAGAVGIETGSRIGAHSFRRTFASKHRNLPLRDLVDPGGWKSEKTAIGTYLQPGSEAQRATLERRAT